MPEDCLIVGLGNPGPKYAGTRHNVGWQVLDGLAGRLSAPFSAAGFCRGAAAEAVVTDRTVRLLKPMTFMNRSGEAVARAMARFECVPAQVLVVTDDFSLPLGLIRLRRRGSDGGHNGLQSVIERTGTADFPRLKLGVGPVPAGVDPADFVLAPLPPGERDACYEMVERAQEAALAWTAQDIEQVMSQFNKRMEDGQV